MIVRIDPPLARELRVDVTRTSDAWPILGITVMVDELRRDKCATRWRDKLSGMTDEWQSTLAGSYTIEREFGGGR